MSEDGETFRYYGGNPVLDIGSRAFRDPDVFWHDPSRALGHGHRPARGAEGPLLRLARPEGLAAPERLRPGRGREQLWEVPNLIRMPLDGDPSRQKWVLLCGMGPNKEQFFVGDFDGTRFRLDEGHRAFLEDGAGLDGEVFADFESGGYAGWTAEGDAFGAGPDTGAGPLAGYLGRRLVSTRRAGPRATGRLTSPEFTVSRNCINFLIGGGNHPGETGLQMIVDGAVVRESTGRNSDTLAWSGWDVHDLKGKRARLRVIDGHRGDWANVAVDHVMFSDVLTDHGREHASWIDWGPDFYVLCACAATATTRSRIAPSGWGGWNWDYAEGPHVLGRGAESIPARGEPRDRAGRLCDPPAADPRAGRAPTRAVRGRRASAPRRGRAVGVPAGAELLRDRGGLRPGRAGARTSA